MNINYKIVDESISYYESKGYEYVEVPWVVRTNVLLITFPKNVTNPFENKKEDMVASGEQSFLQEIIDGKLSIGKYCCATPCYRPGDSGYNDGLHFSQFFKVELINYTKDLPSNDLLSNMINDAKEHMELIRFTDYSEEKLKIEETIDDPRIDCNTLFSFDIITKDNVELGSYGIRYNKNVGYWTYGTGLALPRILYDRK